VFFHKSKNIERMLEAVEKFSTITEQEEFLKKHGYMKEAANVKRQAGEQAFTCIS